MKTLTFSIILLMLTFCFIKCNRTGFYFDLETQEMKSCGYGFYEFEIIDDLLVSEKTFFGWNYDKSKEELPNKINLNNIPKGYDVYNGTRNNKFNLERNTSYHIKWKTHLFLGGRLDYIIRIWTDSTGRVYKTSHPKCGLETL